MTTTDVTTNRIQKEPHPEKSLFASQRTRRMQRNRVLLVIGGRIGLFAALILVWQFVSVSFANPLFISSPVAVIGQIVSWMNDGTLWFHTEITLEETLLGLFFGIVSGVLAGFLFGIWQMLPLLFDPLLTTVYSIPKIALAPLFILWFGIDLQMKVIFAAVTVFFLVFFNTLAGVRTVDPDLIDAVRLMNGRRRDIVLKVIVPAATGHVLTGIYIAVPYALIGAVIGELIASNRGLGYLIEGSASSFNTPGVFAAIAILTIIAGGLNAIVKFVDQKTSRWKPGISIGRKIMP